MSRIMNLSVIIPIHNEEENISPLFDNLIETLERIGEEFEIIMINDGSDDHSRQIIDSLAK
jgi:glycosyltransferase involved in cell wall biosynthesis